MAKNLLYYGDNLDILQQHLPDESVDLIYLDPPFNSNQDYNVLFKEQNGKRSAAQIMAFEDSWQWDQAAARMYQKVVEAGGRVSQALQSFRIFLGESNLLAYLSMMAPRLVELKRVLKETGSIYLHCDPTASHYLKMLMDAVFGPENFKNEIVWKRTYSHSSAKKMGPVHDIILYYSKSSSYIWNDIRVKHDPDYIENHFNCIEEKTGRIFQPITLTGAGTTKGNSGKPWREINPTKVGRHWALPQKVLKKLGIKGKTIQENLEALDKANRIYWGKKGNGVPRLKWYVDELEGMVLPDVWVDIPPVSAHAKERLGYPTQKPEALLERIISASSKKGDVVLDPFCGCGTTVAAAQKLKRKWIGIDITHLAVSLMKTRLKDMFGKKADFEVIGEPKAISGAAALAKSDPYQFQWWALSLVGARPAERKKGADKGIDGRLYFHDEGNGGAKTKQIIISVKAGKTVTVSYLRDLRGVIDREEAEIGVLISMAKPTSAMRKEAASAGFYKSPWGHDYPRLQLLTIEELFDGKGIDYPPSQQVNVTLKKAPKAKQKQDTQKKLGFSD